MDRLLQAPFTRLFFAAMLVPILGLWPFVSAMPLLTLVGGQSGFVTGTLNVLLVLSGFWVVVPGAALAWTMLRPEQRITWRKKAEAWRLPLALYATAWMLVYALLASFGA